MPATTTNGPINLIRESSIESQGTIFDQMEQKTRKLLATRKKYEIDPALSLSSGTQEEAGFSELQSRVRAYRKVEVKLSEEFLHASMHSHVDFCAYEYL